MKLLFATNNTHKIAEAARILQTAAPDLVLVTLAEAGLDVDPPENEPTFEGNALSKARALFALTGLPTVADDSGIEVTTLGGRPGVHSKRFSPEATDEANNRLLVALLDGADDRSARYRCAVALVSADGELVTDGSCTGSITDSPRGAGGFGYDPHFLPDDAPGRTMAELTADEKHAISHRGRAFRALAERLRARS